MTLLAVAVVLVGAIGLLNLLLTFGVIRRLREQRKHVGPDGHAAGLAGGIDVGSPVGDFRVQTLDGSSRSHRDFSATTLVGFFAEGCQPCETLVPAFADAARGYPGGRRSVLAVVTGSVGAYAARLGAIADVVTGQDALEVARAFQVNGYPTLMLVGAGGVVRAKGFRLDHLPELVAT